MLILSSVARKHAQSSVTLVFGSKWGRGIEHSNVKVGSFKLTSPETIGCNVHNLVHLMKHLCDCWRI